MNEYKIILITKLTPKIIDKEINVGIQNPWTESNKYMVVPATIVTNKENKIIDKIIPIIENVKILFVFINIILTLTKIILCNL